LVFVRKSVLDLPKRLLVGRPLRSSQLTETLLPKKVAMPVFCGDPLSSNAYATEEIFLGLSLGGLALLYLTPWVAGAVIILLIVVVASYRQVCHAFPGGGGAYAVSRAHLGRNASLVAAGALLVDYVLTVAVSVAAGAANIASAIPRLTPYTIQMAVGMIVILTLLNLRGIKQSGIVFAVPTYGFIAVVLIMLLWGAGQIAVGRPPVAESASFDVEPTSQTTGLLAAALMLRAFSQGCTALAGMEVVSNGVPNFRKPKAGNAATTLAIMAVITVTMFGGITALALISDARVAADTSNLIGAPAGYEQKTVITQVAGAVFGSNSLFFFLVAAFTAAILVFAANTAFNGFPVLASILGQDGYLPRQFGRRGDRLVFSNGIVLLGLLAGLLVWAFSASTTRLIQLYIIGVFVAYTLGQAGMVRHWTRRLRGRLDPVERRRVHRARTINAVGALLTGLVLFIVLVTKFLQGAWIVAIALPAVVLLMSGIRRHYDRVAAELRPGPDRVTLPSRVHAIVVVSKLHTPTLRALAYARATRPNSLIALTVQIHPGDTAVLERQWHEYGVSVPLTVLDSPYREITTPVLDYVSRIRRKSPRDVVAVFIPEYVVGHWWEQLLHNQSALRLKTRLLFRPGVMVVSVPWQLGSAEAALARRRDEDEAGIAAGTD
jgi:amino acid transporter